MAKKRESPLQKHRKIYKTDGSLTDYGKKLYREQPRKKLPKPKNPRPEFRTTTITPKMHDLVRSLERAALAVGEARDPEALARSFERLSLAREALYEYAHELELPRGRDNLSITLRF